jgi:hypothetical protein
MMSEKVLELRDEMKRRSTTRMSMLSAFKEKGELTTRDLIRRFGTGCSSRLHELREDGHAIVTTYESPGNYRYTYIGQKDESEQ